MGGTAWLSRCTAQTAIRLGHDVTCVARGLSGEPPPGAVFVRADRDQPDALDGVASERWDVVVEVARQPGHVRRAANALAACAERFVFVSSGNVYADHSSAGQDEAAPLLNPLEGDVMESMDEYGSAKVACEDHARRAFGPDRVLIARVGLIGGPGDVFDRTGYWPLRFARPSSPDGAVLVPDAPELPTQIIDVRDLAAWLLDAGSRGLAGTFNATGITVAFHEHLEIAREVAGHTGRVVPADPQWLLAQGVQEWMGDRSLPLWLADPAWIGFNARDSSRARQAGLTTRPLKETLAEALAWELTRDPTRPRAAGLSDHDERELLDTLACAELPATPR